MKAGRGQLTACPLLTKRGCCNPTHRRAAVAPPTGEAGFNRRTSRRVLTAAEPGAWPTTCALSWSSTRAHRCEPCSRGRPLRPRWRPGAGRGRARLRGVLATPRYVDVPEPARRVQSGVVPHELV